MLVAAERGTRGDRDGSNGFLYIQVFVSNPICLGFVPTDIHAQTTSIQLNPKQVKSIYTLDNANPLPGLHAGRGRGAQDGP
jgi:hypothetical protein